jgi:hypothetical protein
MERKTLPPTDIIKSVTLIEFRKKCEDLLTELKDIVSQVGIKADCSDRIDLFFYMETNSQVMRIYDQLGQCWEADQKLADELDGIRLLIRQQWQRDYMILATPASLHPYLVT